MSQQALGIWEQLITAPPMKVSFEKPPERPWMGPLSFAAVQNQRDADARGEYADFFGTDDGAA